MTNTSDPDDSTGEFPAVSGPPACDAIPPSPPTDTTTILISRELAASAGSLISFLFSRLPDADPPGDSWLAPIAAEKDRVMDGLRRAYEGR